MNTIQRVNQVINHTHVGVYKTLLDYFNVKTRLYENSINKNGLQYIAKYSSQKIHNTKRTIQHSSIVIEHKVDIEAQKDALSSILAILFLYYEKPTSFYIGHNGQLQGINLGAKKEMFATIKQMIIVKSVAQDIEDANMHISA